MFQRIRDLREDKDYTQSQVAADLNIAQNTLSQYENGVLNIPNKILIAMAKYYNVSTDYLLGLTDNSQPLK